MPERALASKVSLPILRRTFVPRTALLSRLRTGRDEGRLLTLVSAPAGYGKTTTIRMWVEEAGCPVAWLTLDQSDNAFEQFLTDLLTALLTALQLATDVRGQDALEAVEETQAIELQALVGLLIDHLANLDAPAILVLEEYHLIENERIDQFIALLLDQAAPRLHLVIATREDPDLPLTRLRVRNQLTEIRAADLIFSLEETGDFCGRVMGVSLARRELELLQGRTEGWVAGLQLAALSLQRSNDPARFVEALRGTHRHILDYLIEEVLVSQPEATRAFLRRTSILERLCPALCNAVTGQQDGEQQLRYLENNNLFLVALDEERTWYRYHGLFRELLLNQLLRAEAGDVDALHERAAGWYQAHGLIQQAVDHSFQIAGGAAAVKLIETHALPMLYQGEVATVVGWFDRLPEARLHAAPMMWISKAWALALLQRQTRTDEVELALQAAERALACAGADQALRNRVAGHAASIHAYLMQTPALAGERPETLIETSQRAQRLLPADETAIRSVNALNIGHGYAALADLPAAEQAFRQAFEAGMAGGNRYAAIYGPINLIALALVKGQLQGALQACATNIERFNRLLAGQRFPPIGALHVLKGAILLEQNCLDEAGDELAQGLSLIRWTGEYEAYFAGNAALARLRCIQGDWTGMMENIRALAETRPETALCAQALRHRLAAHRWPADGNAQEEARRWLAHATIRFATLPAVTGVDALRRLHFQAYLCAAHVAVRLPAHQLPADVLRGLLDFLARQEAFAERHELVDWLIQLWVVRTLVYLAQGQRVDACRTLRLALCTAAPQGYLRVFLDEGDRLRPLLESPDLCQGAVECAPFVAHLLDALPGSPAGAMPAPKVSEGLSDREREVLALLAAGQSYKEIGERLFLSLNTVQFHVKNLYGKLAVNKRVQAIEKGRALRLI